MIVKLVYNLVYDLYILLQLGFMVIITVANGVYNPTYNVL